jgi:hypothetical protein
LKFPNPISPTRNRLKLQILLPLAIR